MRRLRPALEDFHRTQPLLFHRQAISYSADRGDTQFAAPNQVLFPDDTFCFGRPARRNLLTAPPQNEITGDASASETNNAPPVVIDDAEDEEQRQRQAPVVLAGLSEFRERYPKVLLTGMCSLFAVALQAVGIVLVLSGTTWIPFNPDEDGEAARQNNIQRVAYLALLSSCALWGCGFAFRNLDFMKLFQVCQIVGFFCAFTLCLRSTLDIVVGLLAVLLVFWTDQWMFLQQSQLFILPDTSSILLP